MKKSTRNPSTIPSNVPSAASAAYCYNALHPRQPAAGIVYNTTVPLAAFAAGNKAKPQKNYTVINRRYSSTLYLTQYFLRD
jgi:hypothetical protein